MWREVLTCLAVIQLVFGASLIPCPDHCQCTTTQEDTIHATCKNFEFLNKLVAKQKSSIRQLTITGNVEKVNGKVKYLKNLDYLDLSHTNVDLKNLPSLAKIKTLVLKENNIKDINFIDLPKNIETLDLSHNYISEIPEDWRELRQLKTINLGKNPINCDCSYVLRYKDMVAHGIKFTDLVLCGSPKEYHSKHIETISCSLIDLMVGDEQGSGASEEVTDYINTPLIDNEADPEQSEEPDEGSGSIIMLSSDEKSSSEEEHVEEMTTPETPQLTTYASQPAEEVSEVTESPELYVEENNSVEATTEGGDDEESATELYVEGNEATTEGANEDDGEGNVTESQELHVEATTVEPNQENVDSGEESVTETQQLYGAEHVNEATTTEANQETVETDDEEGEENVTEEATTEYVDSMATTEEQSQIGVDVEESNNVMTTTEPNEEATTAAWSTVDDDDEDEEGSGNDGILPVHEVAYDNETTNETETEAEGSGFIVPDISELPPPPPACSIDCETPKPVGEEDEEDASPLPDFGDQLNTIKEDIFGSNEGPKPEVTTTEVPVQVEQVPNVEQVEVEEVPFTKETESKNENEKTSDKDNDDYALTTNTKLGRSSVDEGSSSTLYIVIGVIVVALICIAVFFVMKKGNNKKNRRNYGNVESFGEELKPMTKAPIEPVTEKPQILENVPLMNGQNGKINDDNDLPEKNEFSSVELRPPRDDENLLTPKRERVTIKETVFPDSIPKTPVLVHRRQNSEGDIVITPVD